MRLWSKRGDKQQSSFYIIVPQYHIYLNISKALIAMCKEKTLENKVDKNNSSQKNLTVTTLYPAN